MSIYKCNLCIRPFGAVIATLIAIYLGCYTNQVVTAQSTTLTDVACPTNLGSCTANDVTTRIVDVIGASSDPSCTGPNDTIDVELTLEYEATSDERYDLGLFIATDGGTLRAKGNDVPEALTCAGASAQAGYGNLNADPTDADSDLFLNLDPIGGADTCGDLANDFGPVQWSVALTVLCNVDAGVLTLGSCRFWEQNAGGNNQACSDINGAGTGSKCDCDPLTLTGLFFGQVEVRKVVEPAEDPGLFNLTIDDTINAANVSNGGSTGLIYVSAGTYTVGETAGTDTDLRNYDSSITCTNGTTTTGATITVNDSDVWICTVTNRLVSMAFDKQFTGFTDNDLSNDISAGDLLNYTLAAVNDGYSPLTNVTVVDNLTQQSRVCSRLELGEVCTLEVTYLVKATDLGTTVINVGSADSDETDPLEDREEVPVPLPSLSVVKELVNNRDQDGNGEVSLGDILTYRVTVTNDGTANLTNIVVNDSLTADTFTCAVVAPGETCILLVTYIVTQNDVDSGQIFNVGIGNSDQTPQEEDTHLITIQQTPSLNIEKEGELNLAGDGVTSVGDIINYVIVATNNGNITLSNVTVADPLLSRLNCIPVLPTSLAPGQSITCLGSYAITQSDIDAGLRENRATADSNETPEVEAPSIVDLPQNPSLAIRKSSSTNLITDAGQVIPYRLEISNAGNITLSNITVTDPMCDSEPIYQRGDLNSDDLLQLDEIWIYTCLHTVTQLEANSGAELPNTATADSDESEPAQDDHSIPIRINEPALDILKSSETRIVNSSNQIVPYDIVVTNIGNITLSNIVVTDNNCNEQPAYVSGDDGDELLQMAESWSYTCSHLVTQSEIDIGGTLNNIATADSDESEPDTAVHEIPIEQRPILVIDKTSTTTLITNTGQLVPYLIEVSNVGNITLSNITVTDSNCNEPPTYIRGDDGDSLLQISETWYYACTHKVTQADIDGGGMLINIATADSSESQPVLARHIIPIVQRPLLAIDKISATKVISFTSQIVPYLIEVTNLGNMTLSNITVEDINCDRAPAYVKGDNGDNLLQIDERWIFTCDHTVTQADFDVGNPLVNKALADSAESEPVTDVHSIPLAVRGTKLPTDLDLNEEPGSSTSKIRIYLPLSPF